MTGNPERPIVDPGNASNPSQEHPRPSRLRRLNRWQAFTGHLVLCLAIGLGLFLLFRFLWYPEALWDLSGAGKLMGLVIGVDVTLGPLLTFVIFNPRKRLHLLVLDLVCIGIVQVAALLYGLHVVAQSRPVYLVAAVDRLIVVAANEISDEDLAQASRPEYRRLSWTGPVLVGAETTLTGDEQLEQILNAMNTGKDIDRMPRFYVPYEKVVPTLLSRAFAVDVEKIAQHKDYPRFQREFAASGLDPDTTRLIMLKGRSGFGIQAIDAKTARPLRSFAIDLF